MAGDAGGGFKGAVRRGLARATGNELSQRALHFLARRSMWLMGIGSGGDVGESGEDAVVALLPRICAPPFCIFDVGANTGQFMSMAYSTLGDKAGVYHAFEPSRATFEALQKTVMSMRIQPAPILNRVALGNCSGAATLYSDAPGSGLASFTRRRLNHFGIDFSRTETVEVTTLDEYCVGAGLQTIDLLKIDVEGHELDVLTGATCLFERRAIHVVMFEFGGCAIDTRIFLQDFFYFFRHHGMSIRRITPSGYLHPLQAYDEFDEQFRTTNFVATVSGDNLGLTGAA